MKKRICTLLFVFLTVLTFSCEDPFQEIAEDEITEIKSTDDDEDGDIIIFGPDGKPLPPNSED